MSGYVHARSTRWVIPSRTVCDLVVAGPYEGGKVRRLRTVGQPEFGRLKTPPGPWCPDCDRFLREPADASGEELRRG